MGAGLTPDNLRERVWASQGFCLQGKYKTMGNCPGDGPGSTTVGAVKQQKHWELPYTQSSISKMPVSRDITWIARWYQLSSEPQKLRHIEVGWELRGLREPWAACFLPIYQSLLPHLLPNHLPREPLHFHCGQSRCLGNAQR